MKKIIIGLIVVVGLIVGFVTFNDTKLGAAAGQDHYNLENFYGGLTQGSGQLAIASSTASAYTLTLNDMTNNNIFNVSTSSNSTGFSLNLPATSTMSALLPLVGSSREWFIRNSTGSTTQATTIVASQTIDLQIPETTGADAVINNGGYGLLKCVRVSTTAVPSFTCVLAETIVGD